MCKYRLEWTLDLEFDCANVHKFGGVEDIASLR